jgi:hypothetical protein
MLCFCRRHFRAAFAAAASAASEADAFRASFLRLIFG